MKQEQSISILNARYFLVARGPNGAANLFMVALTMKKRVLFHPQRQ
jgi:hypothetical protein